MTKQELKDICETLNVGQKILVRKKTIHMGKYGKSRTFRPRDVSYKPSETTFFKLSDSGEYLIGEGSECYYFSKIESVKPT